MTKEKRTFNSEVLSSASMHLKKMDSALEKQPDQAAHRMAPRQYFAPALINRLAEKIKKL